ncbi:MAG: hypothetical protein AAGA48_30880 [Myxococcota bacterium]
MFRPFAFACLALTACAVSGTFEGPGYEDGTLVTEAEGPFVAVATYARRAAGERGRFNGYVSDISTQLDGTVGLVGYALRGELPGREVWTITVWEDEAAMMDFVTSGAHLTAMGSANEVVAEFDSAMFEVDADDLPLDWSTILERLDEAPEPRSY